jgi:hypothetical protein
VQEAILFKDKEDRINVRVKWKGGTYDLCFLFVSTISVQNIFCSENYLETYTQDASTVLFTLLYI